MIIKKIKYLILLSLFISSSCFAKNIIFDIYGVLFDIPFSQQAYSMTGHYVAALQSIARRGSTSKFLYDIINSVPVPDGIVYNCKENTSKSKNRPMEPLYYLWQAGKIDYVKSLEKVFEQIEKLNTEKFFYNQADMNFAKQLCNVAFDLKTRASSWRPIAAGVDLLKRCYNMRNSDGSRMHKLYILSNMDTDMMDYLQKAYPEIFDLFDGGVISGETGIGILKPNTKIYQSLLKKYELNPDDSIFIDDQDENIKGGLDCGIYSILCKDFYSASSQLEKLGVITPLPFSLTRTISRNKKKVVLGSVVGLAGMCLVYQFFLNRTSKNFSHLLD